MNKAEKFLKKLDEVIDQNNELFSSTNVIAELNRIINEDNVEMAKIAKLISKDPMLTSYLLKVANSSLYASVKKVGTVTQAISMLGLSNIQKILTSSLVNKTFRSTDNKDMEKLWHHSLAVAVASQILCRYVNKKQTELLFTVGLLHDVGIFILRSYFKEEAKIIEEKMLKDENKRLLYIEKETLGLTHADIGAELVSKWNFPEVFSEMIKYHHYINSKQKYKEFTAVIMIANNIIKAMELGTSGSDLIEPIPKWVWGMVNISEDDFRPIVDEIRNTYDEALEVFA
jgi:putative nucleotidyltransferase with HDIG domain